MVDLLPAGLPMVDLLLARHLMVGLLMVPSSLTLDLKVDLE